MKRNRWRVDPADEPKFWARLKNELVALSTKTPEESQAKADELLYRIVFRYADEIAGNFKASSYRLTREIIKILVCAIAEWRTCKKIRRLLP